MILNSIIGFDNKANNPPIAQVNAALATQNLDIRVFNYNDTLLAIVKTEIIPEPPSE